MIRNAKLLDGYWADELIDRLDGKGLTSQRMWQWLHFTSYFGRVHTFRVICQIKSTHLAPAGEGPLHAELLVTGLGVYWPFGKLCAHVIGHRSGDSRGFQLLAGHPAGLDTSPTAPGTGRPGSHHPPGERGKNQGSCKGSGLGQRNDAIYSQKKSLYIPLFSPHSY